MNSGSEKKLSMDELLEKNRPAQMVQPTPQPPVQELTPPPEVHPTKAEWEDLLSHLYTLGYHTERQTGYLKKIDELLAQLPTRTQMEELLKAVKHLEQMSEQAGKRNEKRFSLPNIRRPRLRLLHLDGDGSIASAVVGLGYRLEQSQSAESVMDSTTMHPHTDKKTLRKKQQKKIAQGHAEDDHEEEQTWQQTT